MDTLFAKACFLKHAPLDTYIFHLHQINSKQQHNFYIRKLNLKNQFSFLLKLISNKFSVSIILRLRSDVLIFRKSYNAVIYNNSLIIQWRLLSVFNLLKAVYISPGPNYFCFWKSKSIITWAKLSPCTLWRVDAHAHAQVNGNWVRLMKGDADSFFTEISVSHFFCRNPRVLSA